MVAEHPDPPPIEESAASPAGSTEPPRRRRLRWWQGTLALVLGGFVAQAAQLVVVVAAVLLTIGRFQGPITPGALQPHLEELLTSFEVLGPAVVVTGLMMVLVAMATPRLARVRVGDALGLRKAPWPVFVAAPLGILALGPTSDAMRQLMEAVAPNLTFDTLEGLDELARSAPLWMVLPVMALVPGLSEEMLFRGLFQRSIARAWLALPLSAVLFACYHLDPHHVVAVLPLGFYLAWLGQRTGSLWVPVTAHVANNAAAVLASVYLIDPLAGEPEPSEWWWVPAGWALAIPCIVVVWWVTRREGAAPERADERMTRATVAAPPGGPG